MSEIKKAEFDIQLDEQVGLGQYSNLHLVGFSPTEFILDFATILPGLQKPRVRSRIILTPEHAKRLLISLQENINHYEQNHGPINIKGGKAPFMGGGFA